jgi:hypothetical protein
MQSFWSKGSLFGLPAERTFRSYDGSGQPRTASRKTHVAQITQGLGAYFLLCVLIRVGHSYFGVGRESPAFVVLSHLRMAVYLACVNYWIISLWREKRRVQTMAPEMREKMFTLQMRLKYDLEDLRLRKEL